MPIPTNKTLFLLALSAAILLPSVLHPAFTGVFIVYITMIAILIILDYMIIRANLKLVINRDVEVQLSLLDKNPVEIEINHRGKIPLVIQLTEAGLDKFIISPRILHTNLQPGTRKFLSYKLTPITRGDFKFESINVRAKSRMGFVIVQRVFKMPANIRVVPSIRAITKYKLLTRHPFWTPGERHLRYKGRSSSFRELRDYIQGDEYRSIDWKTTARRNKLTVREYEDERSQNLMIMIDTGRLMTSFIPRGKKEGSSLLDTDLYSENLLPWENPLRETTRLDFTVNASMVLSYVALSKGDRVGLMAFSDKEEIYLPTRAGKGQISRIVNTLYRLKPKLVETNYRNAFLKMAAVQRKRSLVVFFTDLVDPESSKSLIKYLLALHPTHTPLVIAFRDSEITAQANKVPDRESEIYDIAVARDILYQRELALRELTRGGAMTLDLYPEELSVAVVSEYIRLKSAARL